MITNELRRVRQRGQFEGFGIALLLLAGSYSARGDYGSGVAVLLVAGLVFVLSRW
jgi:hypothetical protein